MALVMSNDYAALVAGVDSALLLVGAVQTHSLIKLAIHQGNLSDERTDELVRGIGDRLRAGEDPTEDELATASEAFFGSWAAAKSYARPAAMSMVWFLASAVLVISLVGTILWGAIDHHGPWRPMALYTFLASVVGAVVLLLDVGLRVLWDTEPMLEERTDAADMDPTLRDEVFRRLREHRRAPRQAPPRTAPDAQRDGDAADSNIPPQVG